jgi:glycosyltransferase involved in cell wall biosynthesis
VPASTPVLGYILKGYPRISETFISNEILLLEQLGFSMHLFPMRQPRESFCHDSVKKITAEVSYLPTELLPDFHKLLLPNLLLAMKQPARYKDGLLFARKGLSRDKELLTLKHLFQAGFLANNHLGKTTKIAHLHGHFAHSPTSVTLFASIFSGLPFSFTAHAKDIYTSDKKKLRRKTAKAQFVVTCTKHNKEYLDAVADGLDTPVYCVYHGIDVSLFNNSVDNHPPAPPYNILTVARMTAKKGLPTIYKALAKLKNEGMSFNHTLIGEGDDREEIEKLITELKLDKHCRLLGTKTHEEVLKQFKQSDLFVLGCEIAENGDRDGIPNVLVESLAMGVPALSTKVSAIPEILVDGETGLTVEPQRPDQLANAIKRLLTDQNLSQSIIVSGRKMVTKNFDNRVWINELAQIFHKHNKKFPITANRG